MKGVSLFIFKDARIFIVLFAVSFLINIYLVIPRVRNITIKPMPIDTLSTIEILIEKQKPTFSMLNYKASFYVGEALSVYGYASFSDDYARAFWEYREEYYHVRLKDNGFSHIWMLVAYENPTNFFHIGSGETDNTTKIVTFNGSKDLNRDLVNATMLIFDDHYWNATYMDLNTTKIVGCRCSVENVNYHDIYTYPE